VNIVLFGPPGAGKGTQAYKIVKNFNVYKVSTGDLLREEIQNNTDLGNKIKSTVDKGLLVSDNIINDLVLNILSDKKFYNRLIFDGYPRNLSQAKNLNSLLKQFNQKISCVLCLNVDKESVTKRILGRQICSNCGLIFNKYYKPAISENHTCDPKYLNKRSDDNEKTARNRFETYTKETLPVLDYYQNQNLLYEIDGTNHIHEIYKEICRIIHSLET